MTRVLKFRRGTTAEHAVFAGAEGEVTVNTDKDCLVVHDAFTVGGIEHVNLNSIQRLTNKDISATHLTVSGVSTFSNNVEVGTGITFYSSTGIISATSFVGDGSNLTNTGSTLSSSSGSQRIVLTSQTSGTMTASSTNSDLTYDTSTNTLIVSNISIGGTLTYEDVTNVDSIGVITARSGVRITDGGLIVGGGTTTLIVNGDARITGILTVGTGTISINGDTNEIGIGTVTLTESKISQLNDLTGSNSDFSGDVNISGIVTATNVSVGQSATATTFYGNGTIPIGGIIMWSGTIATIPTGWNLCNGSNGTPNLTSRFIVGASDDAGTGETFNADTGAISGVYAPGNTGGETAHKLTIAEMPAHNHTIRNDNNNQNGPIPNGGDGSGASTTNNPAYISNTGGDNYHENRPKYYALAFIMRTS